MFRNITRSCVGDKVSVTQALSWLTLKPEIMQLVMAAHLLWVTAYLYASRKRNDAGLV
jgi:hypothetical protein